MNRENFSEKFWRDIEQAGEVLRTKPMPKLTQEDFFLFEKTGNRLVYEKEYFGRRKYLTVFGILAEFGEKKEDIQKLEEVMLSVCEEKFWALPAHVNFKALDEKTIDLFAAETAQTLAELLFLFEPVLAQSTVERVEKEIINRVLAPFCNSNVPYSWWETDRCNWAAVCAGSIGMTAIYMDWIHRNCRKAPSTFDEMKEPKRQRQEYLSTLLKQLPENWKKDCLERVCNALKCYLAGMEEDGACTEGLGYYSYGMSYYTGFAELYYQDTAMDNPEEPVDIMKWNKCREIALFQQKCYFGKGISISFSDGSQREYFLPGLTAYLKHSYQQVEMPDFLLARPFEADACYRWLTNERTIRWLRKYGKEEGETKIHKSQAVCELLPSAQWLICKDQNANGYAAKGGHNDENHNHNDIGHFLCVYEGEMLLTDLGAGEYTKGYFSEGRYDILCNRSLGHSVPLINGLEQCQGREYCADSFEWNGEYLTVSFAKAYPKGSIGQLIRKIKMDNQEEYRILVEDSFVGTEQTKRITENLVTTYVPKITGPGELQIQGIHSICHIHIGLSTGVDSNQEVTVRYIPKEHREHDGSTQTVYLIQWDIAMEGAQKIKSKIRISCSKK